MTEKTLLARPYHQRVKFFDFSPASFVASLGLAHPPVSTARNALTQIRYISSYLADPPVRCGSVLLEGQYIDRDHMEDHSVFYARNLYPYPNFCRRAHFFRGSARDTVRAFARLWRSARQGEDAYRGACREFSDGSYLGFAVIKPLDGSPVGRTVLRCFPPQIDDEPDNERRFTCTRDYVAHALGVELTVRGLPFQQQDVGVAACATTAIWSALHKVRDFEEIAHATPAQITTLASQRSLIFGRAMPSEEGLSIDQMCQAVQAAGASPVLMAVPNHETARSYLYSAIASEIAPILIIRRAQGEYHAVAVAGMKVRREEPPGSGAVADASARLVGLYIHDDRYGPYLGATIKPKGGRLAIDVGFRPERALPGETWILDYILFPLHGKIRLSFRSIRVAAIETALVFHKWRRKAFSGVNPIPTVHFDYRIKRSHSYIQSLLVPPVEAPVPKVQRLMQRKALSRYVGIVRLWSDVTDRLDIVFDTTSTQLQIQAITVVATNDSKGPTMDLARALSQWLQCDLVS